LTILCFSTKTAIAYNIISWKLTVKDRILIRAHESRIDTTILLDTSQLSNMDTIKYFQFIDHGDGNTYITRLYIAPNDSTRNLVSEEETSSLMRYGHFTVDNLKRICSLYKSDTVTLLFCYRNKEREIEFTKPESIIKIRLTKS
jgi:hypothetical protein